MSYRTSALAFASLLTALVSVGCAVRSGATIDGGPGGGGPDTGPGGGGFDAPGFFPDGPVNPCAPGCGPEELCGDTGDGNGVNDDCDTAVDEGCMCAPGTSRECFSGTPDRANIGACSNGVEYCNEFGTYDTCSNEHIPAMETCDGVDNDCDGITDNGFTGCSAFECPGNEIVPPLSTHTLRGDRVFAGGTAYQWGIECPSSVPAELCPRLATPNAMNTDVYLTASGAYRVTVVVTLPDGSTQSCAWTLYVRGGDGGLRVELNWDSMLDSAGGHDMDLHLHRWTDNDFETDWFTDDDCYYANCQPENYDGGGAVPWGLGTSDLANCENAPHGGGAVWRGIGSCGNPRLDVDTNGTDGACSGSVTDPNDEAFCAPENINVDDPVIGAPYRVMANFYSDSLSPRATNVYVNIFCGGNLRGSFGYDPDTGIMSFTTSDGNGGGSFFGAGPENASWIVADVVFTPGACGLDCVVYPIVQQIPVGSATGDFTQPFGPAWQCVYDPSAHVCTAR